MAVKSSEKYYWLRLKDDFFTSKRIKKLRRLAGGDTFLIIYLKMQLVAMKNDGIIQYTGLEKSFAEELALDIDEDVDNVQVTLSYLLGCGLAESSDNINFFFPYAVENVGSETAAAQRMREARNKAALLPHPTAVNNVEQCSNNVQHCYTDIEKEKEIDKEKEIKSDKPAPEEKPKRKRQSFVPPTYEEVAAYCSERKNSVDPKKFFDYYSAGNWKDSRGDPVKNWKQKLITWERKDNDRREQAPKDTRKGTPRDTIHYD